jgi:hypothetical protein
LNGLDVNGYHIVNLGIHITNALLVYCLVLLTFQTPYFSKIPCSSGPSSKEGQGFLLVSPCSSSPDPDPGGHLHRPEVCVWRRCSICFACFIFSGDLLPALGRIPVFHLPSRFRSALVFYFFLRCPRQKDEGDRFTLPVILHL